LIIQTQISYINNKDLGFSFRNLIGIPLWSLPEGAGLEALANDYRTESSVEMVSFYGSGNIRLKLPEDETVLPLVGVPADPNFIDLMQIKLITGRTLPEQSADSLIHVLLNRAAVDDLGMTPETVVGHRFQTDAGVYMTEVCGVVENFNFEPLYRPVSGFCFHNGGSKRTLMLRMKDGNLSEQLKTCEQIFKKHFPNNMFELRFPDMELEKHYGAEWRLNHIAFVFSLLAILVACMGVFGLSAFMAEQRTKEIGIRKVMGANVGHIVSLFTNSYIRLLSISLLLSIPIAWWIGDRYLQSFAYRIPLSWWIFASAALITIALTLLTVGVQAIKAAVANPAKSVMSAE
jgi:putative ABC transport system permease protein